MRSFAEPSVEEGEGLITAAAAAQTEGRRSRALWSSAAAAGIVVVGSILVAAIILSSALRLQLWSSVAAVRHHAHSPECDVVECPAYDVVSSYSTFEIRRYQPAAWAVVGNISSITFGGAIKAGFEKMFLYLSGLNEDQVYIPITAPTVTLIQPSGGPFCESTFMLALLSPAVFLGKPPQPWVEGMSVASLPVTCYASRSFSGYANDSSVAIEAAALKADLDEMGFAAAADAGLKTLRSIGLEEEAKLRCQEARKEKAADQNTGDVKQHKGYLVLQYDSIYKQKGRLNEVHIAVDCDPALQRSGDKGKLHLV